MSLRILLRLEVSSHIWIGLVSSTDTHPLVATPQDRKTLAPDLHHHRLVSWKFPYLCLTSQTACTIVISTSGFQKRVLLSSKVQ